MVLLTHKCGISKIAYTGFSWTALLFGGLVPLCRGDIKWFAICILVAIVNVCLMSVGIGFITAIVWWIIFAINYNEWHKNDLLLKGFEIKA